MPWLSLSREGRGIVVHGSMAWASVIELRLRIPFADDIRLGAHDIVPYRRAIEKDQAASCDGWSPGIQSAQ